MADQSGDWSTKANDALSICLVAPDSGRVKTIHKFHPKFSYSIFGDEESIFGYQNLKIYLRYHASSLLPNLQISYSKKFKPIGETSATNIEGTLEDFLPQIAFNKSSAFDASIQDSIAEDWTPPGEHLTSLSAGDDTYEIWKGNLTDKAIQQTVKRIQILIPLFIEGGQAINMNDPEWSLQRWTVFLLFKKIASLSTANEVPYVFMGYSTVYRYFHYPLSTSTTSPKSIRPHQLATSNFQFPDRNKPDLPCRSRISQFLILPPFHGGGVGSRFYEAIFDYYLNHPQTVEITVEDPNETFDDLRDLNDLKRLRAMPEFTKLRINTQVTIRSRDRMPTGKIVDMDSIESLRRKVKIAPRQFMRLVEMHLLSLLPTYIRMSLLYEKQQGTVAELKARKHEYHLWQLFVKQRLYRHNKDTLMQLDRTERIDKLDDAMGAVEADYGRLLRTFDQRSRPKKAIDGEGSAKRIAEDVGNEGPLAKRAKVTEE